MTEFLWMFVIILVTTKLADHFCARISLPIVVGELVIGIIIGPALLNWVRPTEYIELFAEIGVILLMFLAGLESDLLLLKKHFRSASKVAVLGIVFPFVVLTLFSQGLGLPLNESMFIGIVFSATSVSISVQVLREYRKMQSMEGTVILGAAVLDDILVVLLVSFFLSFAGNAQSATGLNFILEMIVPKVLFFIVFFLFAKFIFRPLLKLVKKLEIFENILSFSMIVCILFSIFAEMTGLSGVLGAFFVGVLFSQIQDHGQLLEKVESIGTTFFIPVFFVSIGLVMDLSVVKNSWGLILLFTILAFLTKLAGGFLGAKWDKLSDRESYLIGTGMISRGEMALIIAQMGLGGYLISDANFSILLFAIILTTILAPFAMKLAMR